MSIESSDLSPWAHPKAKAWFHALFRKANLPLSIENELRKSDEELPLDELRMMLAFAVLIGRTEVWPEAETNVLKELVRRIRKRIQEPLQSVTGKPLSVSEHKAHNNNVEALGEEIEIARRHLGMSFRKTSLTTPKSWGRFWE